MPTVTDSLAGQPLHYRNDSPERRFAYTPGELTIECDRARLAAAFGSSLSLRLNGPPGWRIEPAGPLPGSAQPGPPRLVWRVVPGGIPPGCQVNLSLTLERSDGGQSRLVHPIAVEIYGVTQYDPARHALPFANAASEFGETVPSREVFRQTYRRAALSRHFFDRLYSAVVYLSDDPRYPRPGGLCTGIARSTLEFSLERPEATLAASDLADFRRTIMVWHGRQLADRALLASAWSWLARGSNDAFRSFRDDVLRTGQTAMAMDVNVPSPHRRDLFKALIGSGHTVVPYAFRQVSDDWAEVWVSDPNYCQPEQMPESVIMFDLAHNSYRYRHYDGRRPGQPSKVLAVRQEHYRGASTAFLSGLASLFFPAQRPAQGSRPR